MLRPRSVTLWLAALVFFAQGAATSGRAGAAQNVAGRGVIAGRVVDAETRSPVLGASVELTPIRDGETVTGDPISVPLSDVQARARGLSGPQRVTTERDGTFSFSGLTAGTYTLQVQHSSYILGGYLGYTPKVDAGRLRLAADERRTGLEVRLNKYGVIAGHVTDETDEAEVNLNVRLLRPEPSGGVWRLAVAQVARTNDRGEYRFTKLKPGEYCVAVPSTVVSAPAAMVAIYARATSDVVDQLAQSGGLMPTTAAEAIGTARVAYRGPQGRQVHAATAPGSAQLLIYPTTFAPSATSPAISRSIVVGAGEEVTADIRLAPASTFSVSGTLRRSEGAVPRTAVRLVPDWADLLKSDRGLEAALTTTGDNGEFTFVGVPAGTYTASALIDKSGWAPTPGSVESLPTLTVIGPRTLAAPMGSARDPVFWASQQVIVGDRDVTNVDLSLQSGARFNGRVLIASAGGRSATSVPSRDVLAGLGIVLDPVDEGRAGVARPTSISVEGNFATPAFPPGRYFLAVRLPSQWRVKSAVANGQDIYCGGVDLRSVDVRHAVLTLTPDETSLTGAVRAENVAGTSGGDAPPVVVAFPANVNRWIASGMNQQCARSVIAYEGAFVLRNMTTGDYLVSAVRGSGNLADPEVVRRIAQTATAVTIHDGRNQLAALDVRR